MSYVEPLEGRNLLTSAVPGTIYFANADPGQNVNVIENSGGMVLGDTTPGERVNYTTQISSSAGYNLTIVESTTGAGGTIKLLLDGQDVTGKISLPVTGNWNTYKSVVDPDVIDLPAGRHVITLDVVSGSPDLESMVWTSNVQSPPPPVSPPPVSPPPVSPPPVSPPPVSPPPVSPPPVSPPPVSPPPVSPPPVSPPPVSPPPVSPPPPVGGPPIPGTWTQLVDFNFATMKTLDPRLTPHEWWNNGPTAGEGEEESDPANVVLANGVLNLYARKNNSFGTGWTGALVQTSGVEGDSAIPTFSFLYGYAQATIKVPAGQGLWPAFWMLPESHNDANGELDVMEMLDADTTTVYSTVHRQGVSEQHTIHTTDLSKGFHTFGVDWEPGSETFYIDGKETAVLSNTALISNEPARLILDLAVGGSWGGPPNKSTPSPADMKVSDLQVWQH